MTTITDTRGRRRLPQEAVAETIAPAAAPETHAPLPPDEQATPGPTRRFRGWRVTRKRVLWSGAVLVALAVVAASFRPTPVLVETAPIGRGPLEVTADAEGVTRVRDRYVVAAPVTGRLERIALRAGDSIDAGSPVARIRPSPLDPQSAAQARARVDAAVAAREEAETRAAQAGEALAQVERSTARLRAVAAEGAMSRDALERAELQLAVSLREDEAARARVRAATAELAAARAALLDADPAAAGARGVATVRSPVGGRVLRVHEPSERVVPAGTPLLLVGDPAELEVVVDVLSTDAVRVRPGALMRLVDWGGDAPLEARVRLVEPAGFTKISALGVEEQRVNVVGDLVTAPPVIGDAFRIEARIVTWEANDVLKVPTTALFRSGGGWSVFAVEEGRARLRTVRIGHRGAGEAELLDGLREGESVVLFPSDLVHDGVRVKTGRR